MKKSELKQLIKEEIRKVVSEIDPETIGKRVISKNGIVYSGSNLIINHLGEKSSFAVKPELKIDYIKLRKNNTCSRCDGGRASDLASLYIFRLVQPKM